MLQGILGNHRTARNRFLRGAQALSPSKKLPNPGKESLRALLESVEHPLMQKWSISRRKQRLYLPEQEITQPNLSRGSNQEVWVRGVVGVQTLIKQRFRHITTKDRCILLRSLSWPNGGGTTTKSELLRDFFINTGLQIKTGQWSCTTASHQLASDGHCCLLHRLFQTLFQPPEHPPTCSVKHNTVVEPDCEDFHLEQRAEC